MKHLRRASVPTLLVAFLLVMSADAHPAIASGPVLSCDEVCQTTLGSWVAADQSRLFPILDALPERFDAGAPDAACSQNHNFGPSVHAVVLAPAYSHFLQLPGVQNDAALWRALFTERGVSAANLHIINGDSVTRDAMLEQMRSVVSCVRERDQVVLTFSGGAASFAQWGAPDSSAFLTRHCADETLNAEGRRIVCEVTNRLIATEALKVITQQRNEQVLFSSDVAIDFARADVMSLASTSRVTGLRARELANFATQVQNRGADIIFILDTNFAEGFRLLDQQKGVRFDAAWRWVRGMPEMSADADRLELFGEGRMAALYAARDDELAYEAKKTGGVSLGELTFAVSEALRSNPKPTIEQLAREIDRTMAAQASRQVPVFEATDPGLTFLVTREEPQANPERIDMIHPKPMRGAIAITTPEIDVIARYAGPDRPAFASIDGVNVEIDDGGQFRRKVKLNARSEISLRVYGGGAALLAERRLLFGNDALQASLAPVGRRLALIIANQNYQDPAFPTLATPIADARAVQTILAEEYGFTTKLETAPGMVRDLVLVDATKRDIQDVLLALRKALIAEDQLLVYYAGHGQIDSQKTAYWVPVEARASADYDWLSALEINKNISQFASGAVLLISDSCYAGGLSRDAQSAPDGPRESYLAKATRYKARQLIASGGDEPVQDGGGGGHSLFARALLEGLAEMPEKVFTASEVFNSKVKPKALDFAFSIAAEGQTPVHIRMDGDELGAEFVFVRKR